MSALGLLLSVGVANAARGGKGGGGGGGGRGGGGRGGGYRSSDPEPVEGSAFFVAQCDDVASYSVSYDGGNNFYTVGRSSDWFTDTELYIEYVTSDTIIQARCQDNGVIGGFIATLVYDGVTYFTGPDDEYFEIVDSSDGELSPIVYTPKDNDDAWGSSTSEMIDDDAYWIWNSNIKNVMTFQFDFGKLAVRNYGETDDGTAEFVAQCDDKGKFAVSYDGGETFRSVLKNNNWAKISSFNVADVSPDTVIQIVCADTGVVGGFIGTVRYDGREYSTGDNDNFEAVSGAEGYMVYTANGEGEWGTRVVDEIADDAYWMWDGSINNVITFQFDFGNLYASKAKGREAFVTDAKANVFAESGLVNSNNPIVLVAEVVGVVLMFVAVVHMFTRKAKEQAFEDFE